MSWLVYHTDSERQAGLAQEAVRLQDTAGAIDLYRKAAQLESLALEALGPGKTRTFGITAVSATALWRKGGDLRQAQNVAYRSLAAASLPAFAEDQLKELLQTIWSEEMRGRAGIEFAPGEVLVSVTGGEIVVGGAPLELILRKVDQVSRVFYRTVEWLLRVPFRNRGVPAQNIQEQFRPWLFQAPPGSYQFAIRVEKPKQMTLFPEATPEVTQVTTKFLEIVGTSSDDPEIALAEVVPDERYRNTFLKLTRNLAPTGRSFQQIQFASPSVLDSRRVILRPESRISINEAIRRQAESKRVVKQGEEVVKLHGVLRGLELNKDWIHINVEGQPTPTRIEKAGEAIDDVIGPMVNHVVTVEAVLTSKNKYIFRDIQAEE